MFKGKWKIGIRAAGIASLVALIPVPAASANVFSLPSAAPSTATCGLSTAAKIWQAFARFGDPADYWLAPDGNFESSTAGWSFTDARVVWGNDTSGVMPGVRSLALGSGLVSGVSQAVSPPFCITAAHPSFRYTFKANGAVGFLSTFIRYRAVDGSTQEVQVHSNTATTLLPGKWHPSDLQPLATKVPMASIGGIAQVQLVFRTPISLIGAGYQIDNVLVDPYRSR